MKYKNISIVIVTYNSGEHIGKLLASILLEKKSISEVIVVENNSPEKKITKKLTDKFRKQHRKDISCKYILRKKNYGFANSCNYGAKQTSSENILFLNPDTELKKNSLRTLYTHMEEQGADIIGGLARNYKGRPHGSVIRSPGLKIGLFEFSNLGKLFKTSKANEEFYYKDLNILKSKKDIQVDAVSGAYLLAKTEAFSKLGGFDDKFFMYLEDVDLGKRATDQDFKVVFCPHSVILHVGGASSKNKYKIRHQAWFDSRKYYFKKHFGLFTNIMIQPIYTIEEWLLKKIKKIQ